MNLKRISLVVLILAFVQTALQVLGYFQTQYQLVSPIIPSSIIDKLSAPHLKLAAVSFTLSLLSLIARYKGKYRVSLVLSIVALLFPPLYIEYTG